jgi:hypothetical protein
MNASAITKTGVRAAQGVRSGMQTLSFLALLLPACAAPVNRFAIVDFRRAAEARRYAETFDEAFYAVDPAGNVDILLRREQPGETEPREAISQIIHLRTFWRSIPGQTVANTTQINATVTYGIITGRVGSTFEGAGSVFFDEDRAAGVLTGELERAVLRPTRELAAGNAIFKQAEVEGTFTARRDDRRVIRLINELNSRFGPLPPP